MEEKMLNRLNWQRVIFIVLFFDLIIIGCSSRGLNGTWTLVDEYGIAEVKFEKGIFEVAFNFPVFYQGNVRKGTYTTKGNTLTQIVTHIYGDYLNIFSNSSKFDSKWYSRDEMVSMGGDSGNLYNSFTSTFSINDDILTVVYNNEDGSSESYTRKETNVSKNKGGLDISGKWRCGDVRNNTFSAYAVLEFNGNHFFLVDSFPGWWTLRSGWGTFSITDDKIEFLYSDGGVKVCNFSHTANTLSINGDQLTRVE